MALCRYNEPLTNAISLRQQERGVLLGDWRQIFVAEGVGLKGGWVLARGKEVWGDSTALIALAALCYPSRLGLQSDSLAAE